MMLKQKIATVLMSLSMLLVPLMLQPAMAAATPDPAAPAAVATSCPGASDTSSKGEVLNGLGATGTDCSGQGVPNLAATVVNVLSLVAGILSVIAIIFAGIRYTTSVGDSGRISSAKSTLIYALVGLAIVALAQVLVHVVLANASQAG